MPLSKSTAMAIKSDASLMFETLWTHFRVCCGSPDARGLPVNLGHDESITILQLAELVRDVLNSESSIQVLPYTEVWAAVFQDLRSGFPDLARMLGIWLVCHHRGPLPRPSKTSLIASVLRTQSEAA